MALSFASRHEGRASSAPLDGFTSASALVLDGTTPPRSGSFFVSSLPPLAVVVMPSPDAALAPVARVGSFAADNMGVISM